MFKLRKSKVFIYCFNNEYNIKLLKSSPQYPVSFIPGIEYLYENGLLQRTPEDVAQFLHKGEGLSKTAIGDYLGERSEFNEAVLRAFVELHDFTDLILVQALR